MCDTLVIPPRLTQSGNLLFAKNSDREPTEAQAVVHIPRRVHTNTRVRCTFIEVPQVAETCEVILSKPFQMWGAEMGVNEFGVVIGNEAVFTKVKFKKKNDGLTGMDLLRLALERSQNAREACQWITRLLEQYGQDACGGYRNRRFFYHNSFLIADANEAFVLETAGREWAVEQTQAIRSISNRLTIDQGVFSEGAQQLARNRGWWKNRHPFSFRAAYSDFLYSWAGRARHRQACTTHAAEQVAGHATALHAMQILQTHEVPDTQFRPSKATTASVCMHATGFFNPSSTTGSMVAEIRQNQPSTTWLTATPHPCLSVYIPFFMRTSSFQSIQIPTARPDSSLWWKAEDLHRWIAKDYAARKSQIENDRIALQRDFFQQEQALIHQQAPISGLNQFSTECIRRVEDLIDRIARN